MKTWEELSKCLHNIYKKHGKLNDFAMDERYLSEAFTHTEKLWEGQIQLFDNIRFVLLGEAPLYGSNKSYFYNKDSPYTAFFRHEVHPIVKSTSLSKPSLFKHLSDNGFIIVDLFPFAFNEETAISYKHIREKELFDLFNCIYETHLKSKFIKIKNKSSIYTIFSLRYKKHNYLSGSISSRLKSIGLLQNGKEIGCIGSSNMPINIAELKHQYRSAIIDL